jgi:hypothetical protein
MKGPKKGEAESQTIAREKAHNTKNTQSWMEECMHAWVCMRACMHSFIHSFIHTYIRHKETL